MNVSSVSEVRRASSAESESESSVVSGAVSRIVSVDGAVSVEDVMMELFGVMLCGR